MQSVDHVSAVIVTRGDVDLTPVLESLIFDDIVVWDNSVESSDEMTYGRILACVRAKHGVVYSQDDDIIHTAENQLAIVSRFKPGVLTGCMWADWSAGAAKQGIQGGYDDLVFCGSGSVYEPDTVWGAASQYIDMYGFDDFFRLWCDTIVGVIAPTQPLDIRFAELAHAEDDNRMCNLPDAVALKTEAIRRARHARDGQLVGV